MFACQAQVKPELVLDGIGFAESPASVSDGSIIFVDLYAGKVLAHEPNGTRVRDLAYVGGSPNAAIPTRNGGLLITQNGGKVGPWQSPDQREASIQYVRPGGQVQYLATEVDGIGLRAPNDLVFGPDNLLYFTDSGGAYAPGSQPDIGRLFVLAPDGTGSLLAELGAVFPNGIAFDVEGRLVWSESHTRAIRRMDLDNRSIETLCVLDNPDAVPDGIAIDEAGEIHVAATKSGGIYVVAPDGSSHRFVPVGLVPTNCAFIGSWLYVTDGGHLGLSTDPDLHSGALWRLPAQHPGLEVHDGGDRWAR